MVPFRVNPEINNESPPRLPGGGREPGINKYWIPAFAGMTDKVMDAGLHRYDKQGSFPHYFAANPVLLSPSASPLASRGSDKIA